MTTYQSVLLILSGIWIFLMLSNNLMMIYEYRKYTHKSEWSIKGYMKYERYSAIWLTLFWTIPIVTSMIFLYFNYNS